MYDRTTFCFAYTIVLLLLAPIFFPHWHLFWFAPALVLAFYHRSKRGCLWLALMTGCLIDLLSANTRFGLQAINYCLAAWLLYPTKFHFFEENPTTLPTLTWLFSLLSTLLQAVLLAVFGSSLVLTWNWVKLDLIIMPLYDALYAGLAFTLPLLFFPPKTQKRSSTLFTSSRRD